MTTNKYSGWIWLLQNFIRALLALAVVVIALFLLGLAQRYQWLNSGDLASETSAGSVASEKRFICPMMCVPPTSQPGRCPVCGMELVKATNADAGDGISISLTPVARRLAGIQTSPSKLGQLQRTIRTIGSIKYDESRLSIISAYVDGRIEEMTANYVGVKVQEGEDLAVIYSPQLFTAQTEFVTNLSSRSRDSRLGLGDLTEVSRQNLIELGMTEEQIAELVQSRQPRSRISIKSPQSGTVIGRQAVEGEYVKTGQQLFRVADLTTVWLMLDLYPDDAALVRFGQEVEAEIKSRPGEIYTGRVGFIDPTVDPMKRTVQVRVEFFNFDGSLRPGDLASATLSLPAVSDETTFDPALAGKYISPMHPQVIRDQPGECPLCGMDLVPTTQYGYTTNKEKDESVVIVPRSAVLMAGEEAIVYVETEPGRFEIRRVTTGPMSATEAAIVEGLREGEMVATAGNFLLDSQMQLAGNPSLLDPTKAPTFAPGPLQLPSSSPALIRGETGLALDRIFNAYFEIQQTLAADRQPSLASVQTLSDSLLRFESAAETSDQLKRFSSLARQAAGGLNGNLEATRRSFRTVSHNLLNVAVLARGPSQQPIYHFYCPMVPGGGGDWMQASEELINPYWGEEMLHCGERVEEFPSQAVTAL